MSLPYFKERKENYMKRKVRVKGPGVKLNNVWRYINEEAIIGEVQYEDNKEYVEVIEEIEENQNTKLDEENKSADVSDINVGTNEIEKEIIEEQPKEESEDNSGENTEENVRENEKDNENEDEELVKLREEAKELGIRGAHNMKKENLIAKIKEMTESSETETNTENIELSEEN